MKVLKLVLKNGVLALVYNHNGKTKRTGFRSGEAALLWALARKYKVLI